MGVRPFCLAGTRAPNGDTAAGPDSTTSQALNPTRQPGHRWAFKRRLPPVGSAASLSPEEFDLFLDSRSIYLFVISFLLAQKKL
jgi:hypothetical protein